MKGRKDKLYYAIDIAKPADDVVYSIWSVVESAPLRIYNDITRKLKRISCATQTYCYVRDFDFVYVKLVILGEAAKITTHVIKTSQM